MMRLDRLTAAELARRLEMAGRTPHPDLIAAIAARRDELEPLLLTAFRESLHDNWANPEDPRWFRLVHTGRFMIAWQTLDALPTFAQLYGADDEASLDSCEWFEEDLVYFGPAAVPILFSVVSKEAGGEWHYGKALSGSTLRRIATFYPDVRDAVVAHFRAQLPDPQELPLDHDEMWGEWAMELADLGDDGSRQQILALDALGVFGGISYERGDYLKRLARGFTPQEPPGRYDIVTDYRARHQHAQEARRREAEKKRLERQQRVAAAQPPRKNKTGRNEPCPCGSGLKYKKCHGRPGA